MNAVLVNKAQCLVEQPLRPWWRTKAVPPDVNDLSPLGAALAYAREGFVVGPVKAGTKNPGSLLGKGWHTKTSTDPAEIASWYERWPDAGVFIHAGPSNLVVFDLDATEDLSHLPDEIHESLRTAAFQRSRGTGDRGHYVFHATETFGNSGGGFSGWGDVRAGNGVIMAAPSVHPETGVRYEWSPPGKLLPPLPQSLRALLRHGGLDPAPALSSDELQRLTVSQRASRTPSRLNGPLTAFKSRVEEGESRHGALVATLAWAFREARAGYFAVHEMLSRFRVEYEAAFLVPRDGRRTRPVPDEFDGIARWAAAQPDPSETAGELWEMSAELTRIRRHAQEASVIPWGLLGMGLLRALCAVPPSHVLPAIVGSTAPPNLFLGLVGESGAGKGATEDVAAEVFVLPSVARDDLYLGKPGSGEGIPKMFGNYQTIAGQRGQQLVFEHTRVLASMPEVDSLASLFKRDSSTLSATLREAWSGSLLGNDYAARDRRVLVRARRYRMCWSVGVQPERAEPLFADREGGLPQRFIWAAVQDPEAALPTGDRSDLEPIVLPSWPGDSPAAWVELMGSDVLSGELTELSVPQQVRDEVLTARIQKLRKERGGLDGHRLLLMEKVALGFAVLHGRIEGFEEVHWEMAERFMLHSDGVRDEIESKLVEAAQRQQDSNARSRARSSVVTDEAAHEIRQGKLRMRIKDIVARAPADKGVGQALIAKNLSNAQREILDDVLESLVESGELVARAAKSGDTSGTVYRLAR